MRNYSTQDGPALSDAKKSQKNRRDPNVDEVIKQYEDWIKKVDTSLVYRCRIQSLSDSSSTSIILLNAVITESIESGNAATKLEKEVLRLSQIGIAIQKGIILEMHQFLYRTGQLHLQLKNFVHLRAYLFCMMEKRLRYQKKPQWWLKLVASI